MTERLFVCDRKIPGAKVRAFARRPPFRLCPMNPATSRRPFAGCSRLPRKPARLFSSLALLTGLAVSALAGPLDSIVGSHSLLLDITEEAGQHWSVDFGQLFTVDQATGELRMPTAGSALPTDNWSWGTVSVYNRATGQYEQRDALNWHSNERATSDSTSPWRSTVTLHAAGNLDPFMSYAYSVRNNTAATQNYVFIQGESVSPAVAGAYSLYADIAGSLTNAVASGTNPFGTPNAMFAPTSADQDGDGIAEIQVLQLSTDGGANFFNAGVDVGQGMEIFTTGTGSYPFQSALLDGSTGLPIDYWQLITGFSLTPGRDAVAVSGFVEITPASATIPEPTTYAALLGAGTLAIAMIRRRVTGFAV